MERAFLYFIIIKLGKFMTVLLLINPHTYAVAAEFNKEKEEVVIHEQWIMDTINASGITVSQSFKEKNRCDWEVYPKENNKALFSKAFYECAFPRGLQQQGYFWRDKNECDDLSIKLLAKKILEIYNMRPTHQN